MCSFSKNVGPATKLYTRNNLVYHVDVAYWIGSNYSLDDSGIYNYLHSRYGCSYEEWENIRSHIVKDLFGKQNG